MAILFLGGQDEQADSSYKNRVLDSLKLELEEAVSQSPDMNAENCTQLL